MSSPITKKMKSTKIIGTHSGHFHCDEALAVFMLRMTDEFKDADLVRTRDTAKLEPLDIVVDVGGVYSPAAHRYDHHQRGFAEVLGAGGFDRTKLSSAGLVYKHFGRRIVARYLGADSEDDEKVETVWLQIYQEFIESVDAIDNGINIADGPLKYHNRTDLSSRVGRLNPRWNEPSTDELYDAKFAEASALTGQEFLSHLDYFAHAWLPARDIVAAALDVREQVDPSGQVVVFKQSAPWKDHLFALEKSRALPRPILYVLYPESAAPGAKWRIQCVPEAADSFANRKSLPEAWRGVRDAQLSDVCGVPGAVFCHAAGFIGGNETYEGVVEMARRALAA
ncbi:hypothetical protein Q5752_004764 [Cryptotrichosporon argae]